MVRSPSISPDDSAPDPVMIVVRDKDDREITAMASDDPWDARRVAALLVLQLEEMPVGTIVQVTRL
jgi:hypothetical protein